MNRVVLLRHAESVYSRDNCFTGWSDPDLTGEGIAQARRVGRMLRESGFAFDLGYASYLRRSIKTLWLVLEEMELHWIEVVKAWQLNERHYGTLEGMSKAEAARILGEEQVLAWRRDRCSQPPALDRADPRSPANDKRYAGVAPEALPLAESLEQLSARAAAYWKGTILPSVKGGRRVIVATHNNTLRALMEVIEDAPAGELDLGLASPVIYELDSKLRVSSRVFLSCGAAGPDVR